MSIYHTEGSDADFYGDFFLFRQKYYRWEKFRCLPEAGPSPDSLLGEERKPQFSFLLSPLEAPLSPVPALGTGTFRVPSPQVTAGNAGMK